MDLSIHTSDRPPTYNTSCNVFASSSPSSFFFFSFSTSHPLQPIRNFSTTRIIRMNPREFRPTNGCLLPLFSNVIFRPRGHGDSRKVARSIMQIARLPWNIHDNPLLEKVEQLGSASRAINPAEFAIIVRVRATKREEGLATTCLLVVRAISIFAGKLDRWMGTTRLTTDIPKRLIPRAIGYACESAPVCTYDKLRAYVCVYVYGRNAREGNNRKGKINELKLPVFIFHFYFFLFDRRMNLLFILLVVQLSSRNRSVFSSRVNFSFVFLND